MEKEEVLQFFIGVVKTKKLSPEEIVFIIKDIVDIEKLYENTLYVRNYDY